MQVKFTVQNRDVVHFKYSYIVILPTKPFRWQISLVALEQEVGKHFSEKVLLDSFIKIIRGVSAEKTEGLLKLCKKILFLRDITISTKV